MPIHRPHRVLVVALTAACALGLTACTASPDATAETDASSTAEPRLDDPTPTPDADSATGPAVVDQDGLITPFWAHPAMNIGTELGTVELGPLSVQLNDSGRFPASRDRLYSDGSTAMTAGEPVAFLTWTVTNTSDETVMIASLMVGVTFTIDGWTLAVDSASEAWEATGLSQNVVAQRQDPPVYPLGPGESFTDSRTVPRGEGQELRARFSWTPGDEQGELVHDEKETGELTTPLA